MDKVICQLRERFYKAIILTEENIFSEIVEFFDNEIVQMKVFFETNDHARSVDFYVRKKKTFSAIFGSYLVLNPEGEVEVYSKEEFEKKFAVVVTLGTITAKNMVSGGIFFDGETTPPAN